jgi:hypothetical protein
MSLIIFGDGRTAEIIIESTAKPITADMLVRLLLAHGVIAAKIIRTQAAKEIPRHQHRHPDHHGDRQPRQCRKEY